MLIGFLFLFPWVFPGNDKKPIYSIGAFFCLPQSKNTPKRGTFQKGVWEISLYLNSNNLHLFSNTHVACFTILKTTAQEKKKTKSK